MMPLLTTFAFTILVLLIIGLAALILVRQPHRHHAPSDSEVVITGACGDTMSLRFSVAMGRIAETSFKSKGCAYSFSCLQAAADAARGRTPMQVLDIDADFIARKVGHLPQDHQHCAKLAVTTLHAAVDRYMQRGVKSESFSDPKESGLT